MEGRFLIAVITTLLLVTACERRMQPTVIEGVTTAVNNDATAIGVEDAEGAFIAGYNVAGSEGASCLVPSSAGQTVRLGIVKVASTADHGGADVVVWIECLGDPTYRQPY
jgi:hypothetical protein